MGSAVSLVARNKSARAITHLWQEVSAFETSPSMPTLQYPPHFMFAMYENVTGAQLNRQLGDVFRRTKPVRVTFNKIRFFDVEPMVVWAAPIQLPRLLALHHEVHARVDMAKCRSNYLPGKWHPHCTLATQIDPANREAVLRYISAEIGEFDVIFNSIEVIEFSPIEVIKQWRLDL
ncbi:2'-5' RNA ligase family protein [Maritalea porphyrae]|uniref:2'-5' RNA ligase n=1 Tax=Maritalea porphyrae TaxID=880732 RepID=A0ABQ5UN67_9HYPH|nr:2'-5' RNA ligase family protein [Maritalea porphyrae]GLQ16284.1 2'-5' RNA ligase [Maritalea porphyrae]